VFHELIGWYLIVTEIVFDELPVDDFAKGLQILGTGVSVIDIVGVLPDIHGQQGLETTGDRIGSVAGIDNG